MKTKIEQLYEDEKSKGFVNHLIRAYLPTHKISKVIDFKAGQKQACNVCGQKLVSINGMMRTLHDKKDEFMEGFMESIKKDLDGETHKREDNPYVKIIGKDKLMGVTGEKTDTCLCMRCAQDILHLTQNGILMGDKNLSYQVNQMRRNATFKPFFDSPAIDDEAKEQVKQIKKKVDKDRKITTFGDLEALQELKKKMEAGNN